MELECEKGAIHAWNGEVTLLTWYHPCSSPSWEYEQEHVGTSHCDGSEV